MSLLVYNRHDLGQRESERALWRRWFVGEAKGDQAAGQVAGEGDDGLLVLRDDLDGHECSFFG